MSPGAVTVGLAGLGYWGPNLARNFGDLPEADLRWLCDHSPEALTAHGARFPTARRTTRFADLLEDPELEAIVVATPVVTHAELAREALLAGKHVFVEKPMALGVDDAEELVAIAEERGLVLMPGHLLLYHPGVVKLKELVTSGQLGRVLYVYGNRQNFGQIRRDENALGSLGAHDLSVILHLLEEEPAEVWARGECFLGEVEDVVFCYLRFPSGVVAHMHLSWLDPHKMRRMTVVGDQKMAVFDDMDLERKVTVYEKSAEPPPITYGEWRTRTGDISSPKISNAEPLRLECRHFLALARGEGDPSGAARDGLAVVRTLEQLQRSLERERV
ncbi:MAG: Gfo/Idh/MocA family oxidoreductase [Actinomycetota bacterium]|nr:Gfo/Idh/MocA family oxidoreductase [Actinomycetota bacterium]